MVSVKRAILNFDELCQVQKSTAACLKSVVESIRQYPVEVAPEAAEEFRIKISDVLRVLAAPLTDEVLGRGGTLLREHLRNYRDAAAKSLTELHENLSETARAMQELVQSITQSSSDGDEELQAHLNQLLILSASDEPDRIRQELPLEIRKVSDCMERMRRHNQLTVAQFLAEIQILHSRIQHLQKAAEMDAVCEVYNRSAFRSKIEEAGASGGRFALIYLVLRNLPRLRMQHGDSLVDHLLQSFTRRLKNEVLSLNAVIGRCRENLFVTLVPGSCPNVLGVSKTLNSKLAGAYSCGTGRQITRLDLVLVTGVEHCVAGQDPEQLLLGGEQKLAPADAPCQIPQWLLEMPHSQA